jgi:hypothetical protein
MNEPQNLKDHKLQMNLEFQKNPKFQKKHKL